MLQKRIARNILEENNIYLLDSSMTSQNRDDAFDLQLSAKKNQVGKQKKNISKRSNNK